MVLRIRHVGRALALLLPVAGFVLGQAAPPTASFPAATTAPPPGTAVVPRSLEVQNGALVAPGKAPELDILYTGDVIGYIEPCG